MAVSAKGRLAPCARGPGKDHRDRLEEVRVAICHEPQDRIADDADQQKPPVVRPHKRNDRAQHQAHEVADGEAEDLRRPGEAEKQGRVMHGEHPRERPSRVGDATRPVADPALGGRKAVDDGRGREDEDHTEEDRKEEGPVQAAGEHHVARRHDRKDGDQPSNRAGQCINHGLKAGMGLSQKEEKLAVECGYWHLYRFNPALEGTEKNPFSLDSKEPDWSKFREFLLGEVRYLSVQKAYPNEADELFNQAEKMAKIRYNSYVRQTKMDWSEEA